MLVLQWPQRRQYQRLEIPGSRFLRIGANLKEASCLPCVAVSERLTRADVELGCALACQNRISNVKHPHPDTVLLCERTGVGKRHWREHRKCDTRGSWRESTLLDCNALCSLLLWTGRLDRHWKGQVGGPWKPCLSSPLSQDMAAPGSQE